MILVGLHIYFFRSYNFFNKLVNEFEIGNSNENITTMPLVIVNWQQTEFSFTCDIHNNGKKIFLFKSEVS